MNKILLVYIILGIICLASCKRTAPFIIGKWTETTYSFLVDSNNITIFDTTMQSNSSSDTMVFYANGRCVSARYPTPIYGTYKVVGNTIVSFDTAYNISNTLIFINTDTIVSLTSHSLLLAGMTDTVNVAINNSNTTVYTHHYFYSYSR